METQITGSVRSHSNTSKKLKMVLNFKAEHVKHIGIEERRHIEVIKHDDTFKLKFLDKQTARSRPATIKKVGSSKAATVFIDQAVFGLDIDQNRPATAIDARYTPDGMEFQFNKDAFLRPQETVKKLDSKKVETPEQKVIAGFDPQSAWGVGFKKELNEDIRKAAAMTLKLKLEVLYGDK